MGPWVAVRHWLGIIPQEGARTNQGEGLIPFKQGHGRRRPQSAAMCSSKRPARAAGVGRKGPVARIRAERQAARGRKRPEADIFARAVRLEPGNHAASGCFRGHQIRIARVITTG
jgi:hypothetical protein